jgi:hypothetical protein
MVKAYDTKGYSAAGGRLLVKQKFSPTKKKTFSSSPKSNFLLTFLESSMGNFGPDNELSLLTLCHKFRLTVIRMILLLL